MRFGCETPRDGAAASFALTLQGQLPTLATERLILRAPRVTDFDTFAGIICTERGRYFEAANTRSVALAERLGAVRNDAAPRPDRAGLVYRHPRPAV